MFCYSLVYFNTIGKQYHAKRKYHYEYDNIRNVLVHFDMYQTIAKNDYLSHFKYGK